MFKALTGRDYWAIAFGALLLFLSGYFYAQIPAGSKVLSNPNYYVTIILIIIGIVLQLSYANRIESKIKNLRLRIKILELENKIKDLELQNRNNMEDD